MGYAVAIGLGRIDMAPVALDAPSRERKARLIRAMLANDAAVRAIAEPEMHRLQVMIHGVHQGEQARRAYLAADAPR